MRHDTLRSLRTGALRSRGYLLLLFLPLLVVAGIYPEPVLTIAIASAAVFLILVRPVWVIFLLVLVIPLDSFLPVITVPVLGVGATTANVMAAGAFIACIIQIIRKQVKIYWTASLAFFSLFVVWNVATIEWAYFPRDAVLRSIEWLVFWGAYIALSTYLNDQRVLRTAMLFFGLGGWIVLISGLLGFNINSADRLAGLLGNPNTFGTVIIASSLGVLLFPSLSKNNKHTKWLLPEIYLGLGLLAILLSGSRGSMIGLVVILVGIGIWTRLRNGLVGAFFLAIFIIVSFEFAPQLYEPLLSRINSDESDTLGGRTSVWMISSELISSNPIVGYGSGSGSTLVGEQFNLGLGPSIEIQGKSAHSPILEIWIETGIIGTSLYILVIAWPLLKITWMLLKSRNRPNFELRTSIGLFLAVFWGYFSVWIKNGGSTHDKQLFVFLATGMALWAIEHRSTELVNVQEVNSAVDRSLA